MGIGPYPAIFDPADPPEVGYTVTFPGLSGVTQGDTLEEAERMAVDCLVTSLSFNADQGGPFPAPSAPKRGQRLVFVPALLQAKLELIRSMAETETSNVKLADQLGVTEAVVRRLVNLNHE